VEQKRCGFDVCFGNNKSQGEGVKFGEVFCEVQEKKGLPTRLGMKGGRSASYGSCRRN